MPGPAGSCHHLLSVTQRHYRWPTDLLCLSHTPRCSGPPSRAVPCRGGRRAFLPDPPKPHSGSLGPRARGVAWSTGCPQDPCRARGPRARAVGGGLHGRGGCPQSGVGCWKLPLDLSPGLGKDQQDRRGHARHRSQRQEPLRKEASAPALAQTLRSPCRGAVGWGHRPGTTPPRPLQCGHTASGRPEERGQSGTGEQRRGASCAGVAVRAGWVFAHLEAISRNASRPGGLGSGSVNSTARNMDLMGNRTRSQENPDSSPGLHPALGSPGAPPSQGPAAPVATAARTGLTGTGSLFFPWVGWGAADLTPPSRHCL